MGKTELITNSVIKTETPWRGKNISKGDKKETQGA
jgi:hypothetical protein